MTATVNGNAINGNREAANGGQIVRYASAFGDVTLTFQTVKNYLVRGNAQVTDQEIIMFMELCKFQKLNPFTNEVYLIKFGSDSAQTVVGRDAYLRRAYENPDYLGFESGVTVLRGNDVVQKQGACLYPGEKVIGGWCRVKRTRGNNIIETFKEVALDEYNRGMANWKSKPGLMICKVAESQALRAAFPTDYAGLYTAEEFGGEDGFKTGFNGAASEAQTSDDPPITQRQRKEMFGKAKEKFGKDANETLIALISEFGFTSTADMPVSVWRQVMEKINAAEIATPSDAPLDGEQRDKTPLDEAQRETQPKAEQQKFDAPMPRD